MPLAGVGVRLPESNKIVIPTSVSIRNKLGLEVGFVSDINPETTRRVERIRALKASAAGRVLEQCPAPEDTTIRCTGFALYTYTIMGLLTEGVEGCPKVYHALNTQHIQFNVKVEEDHPHPDVEDKIITVYGDCWITNYGRTLSIRNLYITETCVIQPSWILTELSPEGGESESYPVDQIT
jgi:hypothetical protein